jgi:hypothetical protein
MSNSRQEFLKNLETFVDEFIDGYEFIGLVANYTPDSKETFLIKDCVAGLLCEMQTSGFIMKSDTVPEGYKLVPIEPDAETKADKEGTGV